MPDFIFIIISNYKRAQKDPTFKFTSTVSTMNDVLGVLLIFTNIHEKDDSKSDKYV